ncbi:TetR/AcrR family transcriptional regulator [Yinghuangia seranimata]|uniref:TetR/AcrR family transcriptional regulator n=1 Tax=Yinghuangia seranimata TaxID=408067 RepID=UPI00248BDACE|nr:TetR/AcrR family transcriptional regulator [Yinghuangia seranimata]MDI2125634.1 TetR/AcrR family transcriptional regulator [Yinghuangia seranimata]
MEAAARVIARRGVRGLRVEELAAEADVSTGLIYYHFKNREGVLRATLGFINDRAGRYTAEQVAGAGLDNPRAVLEQTLLLEIQDTPEVRENSTAWGELRSSAVFDDFLREDLGEATRVWVGEVADLIAGVIPAVPTDAALAAGERLTALLEGVSGRWLFGGLTAEQARDLMRAGIDVELARLGG